MYIVLTLVEASISRVFFDAGMYELPVQSDTSKLVDWPSLMSTKCARLSASALIKKYQVDTAGTWLASKLRGLTALLLLYCWAVNSGAGELMDKCRGTVSMVYKFYAVKHTNTNNNNKANHTCTVGFLPIAQGLTGMLPLHSHHLGIQFSVTKPISLTIN